MATPPSQFPFPPSPAPTKSMATTTHPLSPTPLMRQVLFFPPPPCGFGAHAPGFFPAPAYGPSTSPFAAASYRPPPAYHYPPDPTLVLPNPYHQVHAPPPESPAPPTTGALANSATPAMAPLHRPDQVPGAPLPTGLCSPTPRLLDAIRTAPNQEHRPPQSHASSNSSDPSPLTPHPLAQRARRPQISNKSTNYKNLLQEWAQRNGLEIPFYRTESKGEPHQLEFRSTVMVDGQLFPSGQCHSRRKDAQKDAAKMAYESLVPISDGLSDVLGLIDQDEAFCKSILIEFTVKKKVPQPTYSVEGLAPLFVSSVLLAGNTHIGEAATTKKVAEQKAARAAVKSILAINDNCMKDIIVSKKKLIVATHCMKDMVRPKKRKEH